MGLSIKKNGIILGNSVSGVINENMMLSTPTRIAQEYYWAYQIPLNINMTVGNTYTLQLWDIDLVHTGKSSSQLRVVFYWDGGMNSEIGFSVPTGHADYLCASFVAHNRGASEQTGPRFSVYNSPQDASGTRYMYIGRWKLEAGSTPTPFSYSPADPEYIGNNDVFFEETINVKFGNGYIRSKEFIEI